MGKCLVKAVLFLTVSAVVVSAKSFVTDGNAIRKMTPGMIKSTPVFFFGELDGSVSCYTTDGKKLWRNETKSPAVLFEIEVADVDGDGRDDLLTASGDGSITCWNANGSLRWKYSGDRKVRFNEVAVLKRGKDIKIFAGGNDKVIYVLDRDGNLITKHGVPGAIRKLEIGDFKKKGEPLLFVMTMRHDKSGWLTFGFLDPDHLKKDMGSLSSRNRTKRLSGIMTDLRVQDLDRDGLDDLLVFLNSGPVLSALNGEFEEIAGFDLSGYKKVERASRQRYAHSIGTSLYPARDEILIQFGRAFYVLDSKGKLLEWSGSNSARFPFGDICMHPATRKLFGAGSVGGDNGVYEFDLTQSEWWMQHDQWTGRMSDVKANLETLYEQVLSFDPPEYQSPAKKPWVMGYGGAIQEEVAALDFNEVVIADEEIWSEDYDRSDIISVVGEQYGNRRDKRKPYRDSRADLIRKAQDLEAQGEAFIIWAGHGSDPFYVSIGTLEAILEAAPNTCLGFTYAEMSNTEDPRIHYFIEHYMPRLAKACRKQGKAKLYFRYKQTFWATTVQAHPWNELFLSGKYSDLLVPGTEDTNSTTQELNLAGRVGMFTAGCVDDFAMRLIDDNPTGWRPVAPGRQRSISPWLRSGVIRGAYGARFGLLWNFHSVDGPGLELLIAMMGSGVLPLIEDADDLASIGAYHLMKEVPHDFHMREHLGHTIDAYLEEDYDAVLSVVNVHWGGASVPGYDFSKALGVDYRWLNFMPKLPHGMVPIAPLDYQKQLQQNSTPYFVSNARNGLVGGKEVSADTFGTTISKTVKAGAKKLPFLVKGASWSAIKLDESHYRIVLVDPHYIDPRDCPSEITVQKTGPKGAVDILSKEQLEITDGKVELIVPAGSMRFVDIQF
ncbi:hypothetical protein [Pontiella agarivorans]|uniref:Lambda-carrageenase n=1 Tax=Pontiella agarivorans TaxID=3038953 RepID=A0ABU5N1A3_9BACT|nr:hypothetical protein [Pontiella agarivorans]MDZ8120239.1 hypothetical protein [Pontiella agarivorans]